MIQLLFAVLDEADQRLEVVVLDSHAKKRRVEIVWKGKEILSVPSDWFAQVKAELQLQDDDALMVQKGRVLF